MGRNGYKWYVGQRLWQQSKSKVIPEEHRKYTLIEFGPQGDYYISSKLRTEKLFRETNKRRLTNGRHPEYATDDTL